MDLFTIEAVGRLILQHHERELVRQRIGRAAPQPAPEKHHATRRPLLALVTAVLDWIRAL